MELTVINSEPKKPKFKPTPLMSFIVPMYDLDPTILKRCLMSLADQDYPNMEVICVLDGPNEKLADVCDEFEFGIESEGRKKFRTIQIEHGGACAARNAGFDISDGEIVSFFNSDYVANPGMASLWVDALLDHPDCGFAYGGYELATQHRWAYPAKEFNTFELENANYIDCGFPLWRKHVVRWDPEVKSLQDWDFWLRVVKGKPCTANDVPLCQLHPVKGFYLGRDISFVAEPPRPKGLSDDSHHNWEDRVTFIKKKNGIPLHDICVTSLGAANHGVEIAKMIGADFRDDTIFKPQSYKALYLIGCYMKPTDTINEHARILAHFAKARKIVHFVGADIYWLRKFSFESLKYLAGALNEGCAHVLCENELSKEELASMGIKAKIVPIPSYSQWDVKPLPEKFSVATFITQKSDFDKYCSEPTLSIVRAMPDVQFNVYGDGGKDCSYPNMKHAGNMKRSDWESFVYANSCLLRIVKHDTMPMASNEFLLAGRSVITNIPATGMDVIDTSGREKLNEWDVYASGLNPYRWPLTKKQIIQKIREVRDRETIPALTTAIASQYKELLDRDNYVRTIHELCEA